MMPPRSLLSAVVALLASAGLVSAQAHTDCNPLLRDDCPSDPAFSMSHAWSFNSTPTAWVTIAGSVSYSNDLGATFTINKFMDSPTIRSSYYIFWGRVEFLMKSAPGKGIVSSMMLISDDLDEVDWEVLGVNSTHALTNYFGKGRQIFTEGRYYPVQGSVHDQFHNYTLVWTKDKLEWFLDGASVRTLLPKDANNTDNYPQTPCRVAIGIWAAGDPRMSEGTREWAGGDTDYTKGPYNMHVKNVKIEDYSTGKEYVYGDRSGSWQSIKVIAGQSTANRTVFAVPDPPEPSLAEKWANLPSGAKIGIYAGAGSFVALIAIALIVYFIKQRRRGAEEARLAEQRQNQERMELEQYRKAGIDPDALMVHQSEYDSKDMASATVKNVNGDGGDGYSIPSTPVDASGPLGEKSWSDGRGNLNPAAGASVGAAAAIAASGGMRSPAPLLRNDGSRSPGPLSPGGYGGPQQPYRDDDDAASRSRQGSFGSGGGATMSPGSPLRSPASRQNNGGGAARSFTAPMPRMGSPGPQAGGYGAGMQRMNSPGPMSGPQRSFSSDPYHPNQGGDGGYGHGGYGGGGQGANDRYWR